MIAPQRIHQLDAIFKARSIALVGISADERKLNGAPLGILDVTGYTGTVYLVNPKYKEIKGRPCYASIDQLPEAADVAVILVRAKEVPQILKQCGEKGIKAAVVISSGFEEVSTSTDLVSRVKEICVAYGIAMVGPNCEGIWSVKNKELLTFGSAARRKELVHSPIAIISQSGSLAGSVARHLQDNGFGCAYVVSAGNETVLGLLDYLEYMISQEDVRVILLFVEGLKDGSRLVELAARAHALGIVLVVLKAGNSQVGREAVASHTGKVSTPYAIYKDVFEQAGLVQVDGLTDLIEAAELFSTMPLPRIPGSDNEGVSVYSIPGGTRALTVDLCEQKEIPLTKFRESTVSNLRQALPHFAYTHNPTDITGEVLSSPELLGKTLNMVADDPGTRALLIQLANRGPQDAQLHRNLMMEIAARTRIPVIISFLGDSIPGKERHALARDGLFCARDPNDAVRYLGWLFHQSQVLSEAPFRKLRIEKRDQEKHPLSGWKDSEKFLNSLGINTPKSWILPATADSNKIAAELNFPVAVKALPEDVDHKTERGLVKLNISDHAQLNEAIKSIRGAPGNLNEALLIQEMVVGGVEVVLSIVKNEDFGTLLAIGTGGVFVELIRDIGYLALPITEKDVNRLIDKLWLKKTLQGFRSRVFYDRAALVSAALRLVETFDNFGA